MPLQFGPDETNSVPRTHTIVRIEQLIATGGVFKIEKCTGVIMTQLFKELHAWKPKILIHIINTDRLIVFNTNGSFFVLPYDELFNGYNEIIKIHCVR